MEIRRGERLSIIAYYALMTIDSARRSTCPRRSVGAIALDANWRVLATGHNGSASTDNHCDDVGCLMYKGHCIRTIHAEINACVPGIKTMVCTDKPCLNCTKELIAKGCRNIYYIRDYIDDTRDFYLDNLRLQNEVLYIYNVLAKLSGDEREEVIAHMEKIGGVECT